MRRHQSLGIGILSVLFCGCMVGACSASGTDPTATGPASGANDSGAAADTAYNYGDSASDIPQPDGSTSTPKDSGPVTPFDAGPPPPPSNDCDLSDPTALIADIPALESGGDGPCAATTDACGSGDCCVNFASAGLPSEITSLFGSGTAPVCVAQ